MANRFPLIVDGSGTPQIEELPSGDNLDLTGSGIVNASSISTTSLTVGGATITPVASSSLANFSDVHTATPTDGQVLGWDNSNSRWAPAAATSAAPRWTKIGSTQSISSGEAFSIEFTSLGSYDEYEIRYYNVETGNPSTLSVVFDYGSGYVTNTTYKFKQHYMGDNNNTANQAYYWRSRTSIDYIPLTAEAIYNTTLGFNEKNLQADRVAHASGQLRWTNDGSMVTSKSWSSVSDTGIGRNPWTLLSNNNNERTAPTKVKFLLIDTSGPTNAAPITTSGHGMISGKFNLYGLTY